MELWKKQLVRLLFHYSAKRMNIEQAFMVKHPHVPKHLYKYRQFTRNHLDALKKGVLWRVSPQSFNDPYDAAVAFDTDRFLVEDVSAEDFITAAKTLIPIIQAGGTWQQKTLIHPIPQGDWRRKVTSELLKGSAFPDKASFARAFEQVAKRLADSHVERMTTLLRQGFSILSLSANCKSIPMWAHYSNLHSGFAIEYDFGALPYDDLRRRLCFPIFYTRKLRDATRYIARSGTGDFNNLFGQYMCLIKKDDWAYENEWRIIFAIDSARANVELLMPPPSAILLGSQVKREDEDTMRNLCRARAIPLKRMVHRPGTFILAIEDVPL